MKSKLDKGMEALFNEDISSLESLVYASVTKENPVKNTYRFRRLGYAAAAAVLFLAAGVFLMHSNAEEDFVLRPEGYAPELAAWYNYNQKELERNQQLLISEFIAEGYNYEK